MVRILEAGFSLAPGKEGEYRKRKWYTGEFETLASGRWFFKLGKSRDDLTHGTVKIEAGGYVFPVEGEGPVVPTVRCLFDPKKKLLVAEVTNEISHGQVAGSLESILKDTRSDLRRQNLEAGDIGQIVLQPLSQKADFYSWAKKLDSVHRVSFKFWPTNPSPRRSFEDWDAAQREAKADETTLKLSSKSDGLEIDSDIVSTGFSQVNAGYGNASASGKTNGLTRTWHSARQLLMRVVDWFDSPQDLDGAWTEAAEDAESVNDASE